VASLQDDSVGVATALSPVSAGHFKFFIPYFIVELGLTLGAPDYLCMLSRCQCKFAGRARRSLSSLAKLFFDLLVEAFDGFTRLISSPEIQKLYWKPNVLVTPRRRFDEF